jgi:outer membrane receptor protein involved in Fe transport
MFSGDGNLECQLHLWKPMHSIVLKQQSQNLPGSPVGSARNDFEIPALRRTHMTKLTKALIGILFGLLLTAIPVFGQVEAGSISGTVKDPSGAVISGAAITVKNLATGAERYSKTGTSGGYLVPALTPGHYQVSFTVDKFQTYRTTVEVTVGNISTIDAQLTVGQSSAVIEVVGEGATQVNTQSQELSQLVDTQQMAQLPSLNRNAYDFVAISGNVSNGDATSNGGMAGQETSNFGVGFSINGQRSTGTEILLDGVENEYLFSPGVGEPVPLDAVQEYSIITNNFAAEYGRASGGVVNVTTKSGSNSFHGSVWEFNRLAAYTANTYNNDANDLPKGGYTRNQFGFQVGGPIIKNKLFISESTEWTRVRSSSSQTEEVFDPAFIAYLPTNAQSYFSTYGTGAVASAGVAATVDQLNTASPGFVGLVNGTTAIPGATPVFDTVNFNVPFDDGGQAPQNTYDLVGRLDYNLSDKTQMFFRAGNQKEVDQSGVAAYSAYPAYDVGDTAYNQSYLFSVTHSFNSNLLNNTKLSFARFNVFDSYEKSLTQVPNLMFVTPVDPYTNGTVQLPGLFNSSEPGLGGLPYGGPQNTIQFEHDLSWTKGRHNMRFGGQFTYIQLNIAYGAYNQAVEELGTNTADSMSDLLNTIGNPGGSQLVAFTARVNPNGALPCPNNIWGEPIGTTSSGTNACPADSVVTPPLTTANAARSYRYKDWALYAQDSWRFTPRLTLNYGLRYEHYGVQHNNHPNLDSNFYFGPGSGIEQQVRAGGVQIADQSSVGQFWKPSWGTFAPRVGFAYDIFGDGKSSLRGGFGISYERNFGNVTYNASFNPPASAVISDVCPANSTTCAYNVTNNDLGPLGLPGPSSNLPPVELRMPDPNIKTAQTQFWSLGLQREVARNTIVELSYSGAHGVHLYDIENINQFGAGQLYLGDPLVTTADPATGAPCPFYNFATGGAECATQPNSQYAAINMRGSLGSSSYHALNVKFQTQNLRNTGLSLVTNYTWSHTLDDISSTFSDSLQGGSGYLGSLGYTNPFDPKLDWGNGDSDVRHRIVVSPIWETPWFKNGKGVMTQALGGWSLVGVFTARTGIPFNIYDYDNIEIGYTVPRLTPATEPTFHVSSNPQASGPNTFNLLSVPVPASFAPFNAELGYNDLGPFPAGMTARNAFRGPGAWNLDTSVGKKFKLTERFGLEFRAEGFNIFNHHNMYTFTPDLDYFQPTTTPLEVTGLKGGLNNFATGGNHDERRFGQFSLRATF